MGESIESDPIDLGIEDILLLGFMVGGGYGMTIFSLIDEARKLMPNKSFKFAHKKRGLGLGKKRRAP